MGFVYTMQFMEVLEDRPRLIEMNSVSIGRIEKLEKDIDGIIYDDDSIVVNHHYLPPFAAVQYLYYLGFWKEKEIDFEFGNAYIATFGHIHLGEMKMFLQPASGFRKGFSLSYTKPKQNDKQSSEDNGRKGGTTPPW